LPIGYSATVSDDLAIIMIGFAIICVLSTIKLFYLQYKNSKYRYLNIVCGILFLLCMCVKDINALLLDVLMCIAMILFLLYGLPLLLIVLTVATPFGLILKNIFRNVSFKSYYRKLNNIVFGIFKINN
jgi:hypothetical protein